MSSFETGDKWRKCIRGTILGISGATNSGKTTIAKKLTIEVNFYFYFLFHLTVFFLFLKIKMFK